MKRVPIQNTTAGFTLIELLVVIAIIGLLSSVILASLSTARAKSRDARRVSDMKQLVNAIELFYSQNGRYPGSGVDTWYGSYSGAGWMPEVTPAFLSAPAPVDPTNVSSPELQYYYVRRDTDYCIQISQENANCGTNNPYYIGVWNGSCKLRIGSSHNYCWSF